MKEWLQTLFRRRFSRGNTDENAAAAAAALTAAPESVREIDAESAHYSSDLPITTREQDQFGRWPFANRIAETIARRKDPDSLVIGLYGPWGDGKTSTLLMMQASLSAYGHVVVVSFNPWHFGSEAQLLRGFFATLSGALGKSLSSWKEKMGGQLEKYGSILSVASISVGGVIDLDPGNALREVGGALSSATLEDLRERVDTFLEEERVRVVVLIDDIDRLDRAETHAIFKLVKLSASFRFTTYVLAFDDDMVAAALGERYGDGGTVAGRSFLEKIVQVPLHLPPPDEVALRLLAFHGVDDALTLGGIELTREQSEAFARHFVDGLSWQMRTPRQAKLYANALAFALPLLRGEVAPVDLMLIEGIRIFYPKLYSQIRDNPDLFVPGYREDNRDEQRRKTAELIKMGLLQSGVPETEHDRIRKRLLEPVFPRIGTTGYGHEWDAIWAKSRRICTREYFPRYFSYSVPPGDVSDADIRRFLDDAGSAAEKRSALDGMLVRWGETRALPRAIGKLRQQEDTTTPIAAGHIAVAIARNAFRLPREEGMLSVGGTFVQAAILVAQSMKQIPEDAERVAAFDRVLQSTGSLVFKTECFRWSRHNDTEPETTRLFSEAAERDFQLSLAAQIRTAAARGPLYEQFDHDTPALFWLWVKVDGRDAVRPIVQQWIGGADDAASKLLQTYIGRAWGLESGLSRPADFRREAYNSLAEIIEPATIFDRLQHVYGRRLDNPTFYDSNDTPLPLRIARQFAFIHEAVIAEEAHRVAAPASDS